jgi:hypothetical protein
MTNGMVFYPVDDAVFITIDSFCTIRASKLIAIRAADIRSRNHINLNNSPHPDEDIST